MEGKLMVMRMGLIAFSLWTAGVAQVCSQSADTLPHKGGWTLRECTEYAVAHNIEVRQKDNVRRQRSLQLSTDRNSRLPGVDASVGQNFSFGRGLTSDNTYTNTNTSNTSFSLGASLPILTGMRIPNAIKLSRLNLEAATADLDKARNDIRIRVAEAYVEVLYDMEIADVAHRQVDIDSMQVERLRAMLAAGKASESELSQQQAALAQSRLTATLGDNDCRMGLLALSQLLELPTPEGFSIARPDVGHISVKASDIAVPDAIFAEAMGMRPEIQAERLRLRGTEYSIRVARSALYPQLSLTAGLGTNYYRTSGASADGFSKQIKNNFNQYVGLSLTVPLFDRFQTRNSIRSAKIDRETQSLQLESVKKELYTEIQKAYYSAVAACAKYESSVQAARSSEDAFTLMKAKYENGKANVTEFNEAKNNYMKACSDLAQARYECLYQQKLVDFYRGQALEF